MWRKRSLLLLPSTLTKAAGSSLRKTVRKEVSIRLLTTLFFSITPVAQSQFMATSCCQSCPTRTQVYRWIKRLQMMEKHDTLINLKVRPCPDSTKGCGGKLKPPVEFITCLLYTKDIRKKYPDQFRCSSQKWVQLSHPSTAEMWWFCKMSVLFNLSLLQTVGWIISGWVRWNVSLGFGSRVMKVILSSRRETALGSLYVRSESGVQFVNVFQSWTPKKCFSSSTGCIMKMQQISLDSIFFHPLISCCLWFVQLQRPGASLCWIGWHEGRVTSSS